MDPEISVIKEGKTGTMARHLRRKTESCKRNGCIYSYLQEKEGDS
jgi:hypothetical protein